MLTGVGVLRQVFVVGLLLFTVLGNALVDSLIFIVRRSCFGFANICLIGLGLLSFYTVLDYVFDSISDYVWSWLVVCFSGCVT